MAVAHEAGQEQAGGKAPLRNFPSPFGIMAGLLAVVFVGLVVYTIGGMVIRLMIVDGSLNVAGIERALGSRGLVDAVTNTLVVLLTAGPAALTVGSAFAWLNERTDARVGWISRILPLVPLLLPPIALSIGWVFLGSEQAGLLNAAIRGVASLFGVTITDGPIDIGTWPGLIFVYTLYLVPYAYLIVSAALQSIDGSLEEASRMSGAGVWRTAAKVSLPAIVPAIGSAGLLVAVIAFALYSIPTIIGASARVTVLSVHIVRLVNESFPPRLDEAVVLSLAVVIVVGTLWLLQRRLASRQHHATIGGKGRSGSVVHLGKWRWPARALMLGYLLSTSLLPLFALILVAMQPFWTPQVNWSALSLDNFIALVGDPGLPRQALINSALLGFAGATLGMAAAAILMVYAQQRGGSVLRTIDGTTKAPGALSHIVIGVAFVVSLSGAPFQLAGTNLILLLAYITMYMPQASIAAGSANEQIGEELVEASRMAGASAGRTFRRVSLPLMVPGLAAGWALLFVVMAGDLTASALLAGTNNPVVGFVILSIWENGTFSDLAAMGALISMVSTVLVGSVMLLAPRFGGTEVGTG